MVRQQAAALIVAIMITVVVAMISTAMMVSQHLSIFETSMINNNNQMLAAADGMTDTVRQQLLQIAAKNKRKILTFYEQLQPISFNGAQIKSSVIDAMGQFNINCLTKTANMPAFAKLIRAVNNNFDQKAAMAIAQQVSAWVRPSGGQAQSYQPGVQYQIAHRPMADISELRLVSGVTAELMRQLRPYVIALPPDAKMNLNAVPAPVLYALFKDKKVTMDKIKDVLDCRKSSKGFKNAQAFTKCLTAQNIDSQAIDTKLIAYDTSYFIQHVLAHKGVQNMLITRLIYIGTEMPQWQSASSLTVAKNKTKAPNGSSSNLLNNVQNQLPAQLGSGSLSSQKKPQKPLYSYVLWQSW